MRCSVTVSFEMWDTPGSSDTSVISAEGPSVIVEFGRNSKSNLAAPILRLNSPITYFTDSVAGYESLS